MELVLDPLRSQPPPSSELPTGPINIMHSNSKGPLQPPKRRISTRRGSISASDPWGTHSELNLNPNLSSSSTLTIVRVTSPPISPPSITLCDPPSSPALHHRRNHRRHGSGSSVGSNSSQTSRQDPPSSRLSFAFSSFLGNRSSGPVSNNNGRPESPTSSRTRPSSPSKARQSHSHSFSHPRLSPDQLVELAHQSTNPRHITPSHTPASHSPGPTSPYPETAPASFIPMDDDVWLPFIDRPMEVSALISNPPSVKLFSLLAQTFPRIEGQPSPSIAALSALPKEVDMADFNIDPTTWTFVQLYRWLTIVPRSSVPDILWVRQARTCIFARSELIWERVKGTLGVPPELDTAEVDQEEDRYHDVFTDWATTTVGIHEVENSTARTSPEDVDVQNFNASPVDVESDPESNALSLSIESIMALPTPIAPAPSSHSNNLPPLSLLPSLAGASALLHSPLTVEAGLQDISEDQEETDEDPNVPLNQKQVTTQADYTTARPLQDTPPQETIQGLKISTTPLLSSPMMPAVTSPITISHSLSHSLHPHTYNVSSSPSQKTNPLPTFSASRSFSHFSSPPHPRPRSVRTSSFGSVHSNCSSAAYDPLGDRIPGNPLFPSNFARLAVGPTLKANNPALRSPPHPPLPAYPFLRSLGAGRRPSWAESWDPLKQEYAVTAGSEGSVGGD